MLQFLSDLVHILDDFMNEAVKDADPKLRDDLKAAKDCNKKIEERFHEMKNQISDLNKAKMELSSQVAFPC